MLLPRAGGRREHAHGTSTKDGEGRAEQEPPGPVHNTGVERVISKLITEVNDSGIEIIVSRAGVPIPNR